MTNEEFLKDVCPNHTGDSKWNRSELLHILDMHKKQLSIPLVSKRLEMRKQAINVFELTKGFTTEPTDNAMKTALEMAHNVMVLTADLDGQ